MALSTVMEDALNQRFNWRLTNVPELESPILIVLDYSPDDDAPPLSIALDYADGPKCWMSQDQVIQIDSDGPRRHDDYKQFVFEGRRFYPYSIQNLGMSPFEDIQALTSVWLRLYRHVDWD
ncbi:MAG: hypothetical protein F4010_02125 [Cenarchaeum sp. SB0669_bin_11]|nr:hypothetical protein [Gammaproteobacteria bacterium]MYL10953.1 hypothetical protein [Cenarchaeum sp. SB0669_bin_11]